MAKFNFPFIQKNIHSDPKPILSLWLGNSHDELAGRVPLWGLIDTGADQSIIPESAAKEIGHFMDQTGVRKGRLDGIGGGVNVWFHTFDIKICLAKMVKGSVFIDYKKPLITVPEVELAVVPDKHYKGDAILGVADFLKDYILTINYPRQVFSLETPSRH